LLPTLKTYLACNNNLKQAAYQLHLSIAGLRYRLQRIEELCGIDLDNAAERFNCYLAIQIYYTMQMIGKNILQ
jgi:DNA-binding PucR family transcriptional regulator